MTTLPSASPPADDPSLTPAGIQPTAALWRRRAVVVALNLSTYALLLAWVAQILGAQGWSAIDMAIFACFAVAVPWSVLGVWNALIGLWLLHGRRHALADVAPYAEAGDAKTPIRLRTAVVMTVRNEDPARAYARLETVIASLAATGEDSSFSFFILSDTSEPDVGALEERAHEALKGRHPDFADRLIYRRRTDNAGYKAGNLREFCDRWGADYEFMLPLDADSLMSGETILRMVRMAQAYPRLGILQSLVVGAPASSGFARIFQFGMRHGMRPYTMGSAWWTADCGPFWGHNALVRIAPFRDHCHLPLIPGKSPLGGQILSHDQVEAVLMRRAGFEVRVLPEETGSYEDNPPTLLEFTRRDLRWCQGNMQYWALLGMPGLKPTSRFQLLWAIMMFIGIPAFTAIFALSALKPLDGEDTALFPAASALGLYAVFLAMYLAPKLAGFIDIAMTPGGLARYGGAGKFLGGALLELGFSFLLGAATTLRTSLFMIGLLFGRSVIWNGQARDAHALSFATAAQGLWPQMAFGVFLFGTAAALAPGVILWSLPMTLGYLVAIPFAVMTASPRLGEWLARTGLCALPEDLSPPPILQALASHDGQSSSEPRTGPQRVFETA
ncbi:MAG: glucans biosynthesis glucosyltransferase MdoH [Beijerinckiaceae bacterium]|nr:glucans biosynthesis glucosyltransferase MdoH [Beijerinckiaceae bacterium]